MQQPTPRKHFSWIKLLPVVILLLGLAAFFYFRLYNYLTLDTLKTYRSFLVNLTVQHPILIALCFIGIYTFMTAISAPNATFLTLIGGFLFGPFLGTIYVVFGATMGAALIFIAAKTAFYDFFHHKAGKALQKFETGFKNNAVSYLLFLRLVPLFPFWLVNIAPAFLGIRLRTFVLTTFFGIMPGTIVYILLGNGIGIVLDQGKTLDLKIIFKPEIFIPIIGLAILSLIPIIYKKLKREKST